MLEQAFETKYGAPIIQLFCVYLSQNLLRTFGRCNWVTGRLGFEIFVETRLEQFTPVNPGDQISHRLNGPNAAVTGCKGHLFVASHIDFLLKIIAPEKEPGLLRDDVDYQLVTAEIEKFEPKEKCFRFFSRTDEEYRPTYELIRQNKMPEGETMLARMLNVLFGEGKKGTPRAQKIDGSQLPEYQVVRRYLGPAGMQISSEKDGWFLKGFTLSKETE